MVETIDQMTGLPIQAPDMSTVEPQLKYPKGRKVVVVNKIPVVDEPNEFDDGKFPFIKHVNYILPREFYGISEVEQIKGPQRIFNTLISYAMDVLILTGNPIWVVDTNSGIEVII